MTDHARTATAAFIGAAVKRSPRSARGLSKTMTTVPDNGIMITRWRRGDHVPRLNEFLDLCRALGLSSSRAIEAITTVADALSSDPTQDPCALAEQGLEKIMDANARTAAAEYADALGTGYQDDEDRKDHVIDTLLELPWMDRACMIDRPFVGYGSDHFSEAGDLADAIESQAQERVSERIDELRATVAGATLIEDILHSLNRAEEIMEACKARDLAPWGTLIKVVDAFKLDALPSFDGPLTTVRQGFETYSWGVYGDRGRCGLHYSAGETTYDVDGCKVEAHRWYLLALHGEGGA